MKVYNRFAAAARLETGYRPACNWQPHTSAYHISRRTPWRQERIRRPKRESTYGHLLRAVVLRTLIRHLCRGTGWTRIRQWKSPGEIRLSRGRDRGFRRSLHVKPARTRIASAISYVQGLSRHLSTSSSRSDRRPESARTRSRRASRGV